jgi:membrane protein implicated in regulation of membrane protease activity
VYAIAVAPHCAAEQITHNVVTCRHEREAMADSTLWWLLAGAAVAVELVTGTFYLLMLAVGLAAAAVAAHLGMELTTQLVTAAVVGGGAVAAWHLVRGRRAPNARAAENPDVNLDVGEQVHVDAWLSDGTAHIKYRGADWTVIPAGDGLPLVAGLHRVCAVQGSRLVVEKI